MLYFFPLRSQRYDIVGGGDNVRAKNISTNIQSRYMSILIFALVRFRVDVAHDESRNRAARCKLPVLKNKKNPAPPLNVVFFLLPGIRFRFIY